MQWEQYVQFKRDVLSLPTAQERFTAIYRDNLWGNTESVSGTGSTVDRTTDLRSALSELIRQRGIRTFLDVPCGDFNWMKHVVTANPGLVYIGGDIVEELVAQNRAKYSQQRVSFHHLDLTSSQLPAADILMCRGCLHHMSYADTRDALGQFLQSKIPLFLTTNHIHSGDLANHDIVTGDYRLIDLFAPPYSFAKNVLWKSPECVPSVHQSELCLWSREQIEVAFTALDEYLRHSDSTGLMTQTDTQPPL